MKSILLFGAGRIGRSFIAQLFHRSGYDLTFVDIDRELIDRLKKKGSYPIIIKEEGKKHRKEIIRIHKALHFEDKEEIRHRLAETDICSVSVGQNALPEVARILSKGLEERQQKYPEKPLDIILAENLRNAAAWMKKQLKESMDTGFPLDSYVGLIETSIGRMVPFMKKEDLKSDPLQLFAEPYNTLILDRLAFKNPVPAVEGLAPKENMKAWVDRKLFIHNLGHASLAYLANFKNPRWIYTWEALEDKELRFEVYQCMQEAANVLSQMHPGVFSKDDLTGHINNLLQRFANKSLGDTIFRVGSDLPRKLGPEDRLVPVIRYADKHGFRYNRIMKALLAAIQFDARDEYGNRHPEDEKFLQKFNRQTGRILAEHCKFDTDEKSKVFFLAMNLEEQIQKH